MLQKTPSPDPGHVPRWVGILTLALIALLLAATCALLNVDVTVIGD